MDLEPFTVEELLRMATYWEDIDSSLVVITEKTGQVVIGSYDQEAWVQAPTMKEALIKYIKETYVP